MNAKPPTPSAASQAVGEAFHASATDGSPTRMPPTENAKKTVGAGTFAVARSARIEVTAAPPNTAETSPIISPVPSRKAVSPPPTTRNTPAVATARAIARWTVGRSPRRKIERRTAQIGKVLLRSVASPAGIRWIAMKYRSAEIPPKRPREARRSQRAGRKVPGFSRNRARTAARPIANRSRITCPAPIPPWAATRTRIADRPKKKAAVKRSARAPMRRTSRTGLTAARGPGGRRALRLGKRHGSCGSTTVTSPAEGTLAARHEGGVPGAVPLSTRACMSEPDTITVKGAREHNLKSVHLEIPKKKLVVFTGVSGSGKSSLAFDTLYAEGQRRYVESLSSYARQFLGQMEKPKVEHIRGLSPTIAIEQKTASSNPRSTVGTVTEIYDYLRVLYARAGEQRCHLCGGKVSARSAAEMVDELLTLPARTKITVLAP